MKARPAQPARSIVLAWTLSLLASLSASARTIPAQLPDPDGKPGDAKKPVKVYLLAGQSNMVGMGDLRGARNPYAGVYYSSNPAVPEGPLNVYKVGNYKIARLEVAAPGGQSADQPLAVGRFVAPENGVFRIICESGNGQVAVDGKVVEETIPLEGGKWYGFKIVGFQGAPPWFWLSKTDLLGKGDLEAVTQRDKKFPWLVDDAGEWTVRNDVYFYDARIHFKGSPLSPTSNGKSIGPELGFGHVLGTFHDEQVLLIKTSMGNRALGYDFRPPSSGRNDPESKWESLKYKLMVEGTHKVLNDLKNIVPGYQGQGYEMAGFAWWQGHKDGFSPELIAEYEQNLVNLIQDVRKEFKAPKMPAVVATVGFGGHNMQEKYLNILEAQMAVANPAKRPELAGTVATVDIRDLWREVDESPVGQGHHYNRNAETYMLVGDMLGRAMVKLLGGTAEPIPQAPRPRQAVSTSAFEPTEEEKAAAQKAVAPIVLGSVIPDYVNNPRYRESLLAEASSTRPKRANQFLRGAMYGLGNAYRAAGIDQYEWRAFGPALHEAEWEYFSFDPKEKGPRYRKVTLPEGMENWTAPEFDSAGVGWKKGRAPFGQSGGQLAPLRAGCTSPACGCGIPPKTLWEKEALLIRGTFEVPPLREGHRYRIVVGGAAHVNSGEGYAIYVNGKPLAESRSGVGKRQGGQPRGGHIYADFRNEFKGGPVTLALISFLRYKGDTPQGHLSLRIEEQKVPPVQ